MRLSQRLEGLARYMPALLLVAVLVYLWPLTLSPLSVAYPPGSAYTDLLVSHLPNADYARRVLWEFGQWPLWNTQLFAGQPFAADPLAGLWYPPGWLLLVPGLPLVLGFSLLLVVHLAWGGLGVYQLLRAEAVTPGPALLAGLMFAGAPKLVAHLGAGHISLVFAVAWTPWLLYAVRLASTRAGMARGAVAGACLALVFLADVRWAFYAGLLAVGYGVWEFLANRLRTVTPPLLARAIGSCGQERGPGGEAAEEPTPERSGGLGLKSILTFVLTSALLSAVLAVPLLEFLRHSNRTALTLEEAAVFSLPPVGLLGVLLRNPGGFHEHMTYAGTVTALLGLTGIGRRTLFWCLAILLAAAFALGTNFVVFPLLFRLLPGMSLLRVPPRAWFVVALGLCMLAGHGAQTLTERWWPHLVERYARVRIRLPAASTALAVMMVMGVLDLARFNSTLLEARPMPALSPAAAWLAVQPGQFRVYSPSYSLPAGDGLEHVDGVDPLQLAATVAYVEAATGVRATGYSVTLPAFETENLATANVEAIPNAELLGRLNVRYVAAEFPMDAAGLRLARQFGTTHVYENEAWQPRAWLAGGGAAEVITWTPNRVVVAANGPGRLVLSEVAYPGWQARVDGELTPSVPESGLLRALDLPPGPHQVEFVFRPTSVFIGLALSLLGLAGLLALLMAERRAAW